MSKTLTKLFLTQFTLHDGMHEHTKYGLVEAKTLKEAEAYGESQQHDQFSSEEGKETYWDYGDHETECVFESCEEISNEEADVLIKLGVCHIMNERD